MIWSTPTHKRVNWRQVRPHNKRPPTRRKDRRGRMWIERTQSSGSHYWGRTPLLRTPSTTEEAERPLALQISALFCTAAASTLSATAAAGKVQGSSSKVQQGPASPESIVSNFYNSGTLASSSTSGSVSARREKSLNYVLFFKKNRALAASFLGSDPPFPSRATFTSIYLYQRKRTTRKRRGTSLSKGKPSRQKYKSRESQSSGPAGCLVHAVPGAATAASEYKLLKVSEYEAKLLKVRGSDSRSKRDMDQRHVLYTRMPWSLMHCFKVQGKALRQRSVSKFKDACVSIERYCQRCEGESSFGIQNV